MVNVFAWGLLAFFLLVVAYVGVMHVFDRVRENTDRLDRLEDRVDELESRTDGD
jgi:cbb3-type cytochrome oxidase subunit 3